MENNSNQYLGEERVGRLMRKYAIPYIISLLVGALYNIIDQIFIALSIAVMIGDGCCAYASLKLGRQEIQSAKKSVGNSVMMVIISGLILCAVYLTFSSRIIAMFGGTVNDETFRYSKEYLFYCSMAFSFSGEGEREQWLVRIKQYLSPGIPATLWVEAVGSIGSLTISG